MGVKRRKPGKAGRIGVLMGGRSAERKISLKSGRAVLGVLLDNGYDAVSIDVGSDLPAKLIKEKVRTCFIALHGPTGEDGSVQGLLEVMGLPYTGSGVLSSALCMDKAVSKKIMNYHGIASAAHAVIEEQDALPGRFKEGVRLPYVVKPSTEGSALGVSIVKKRAALEGAVREAFGYSDRVIVEEFIEGTEVTVSIIEGRALPAVEIRPRNGFYDFTAKYTKGEADFTVPARFKKNEARRVEKTALETYLAFGCRGGARIDMIVDLAGRVNVLEVNTVPGLTDTSLMPMAAAAAGMDYRSLIEELVACARLG